MAIYLGKNRSFVAPIHVNTKIDESAHGDVYVYEISAGRRATLSRAMSIVPKVAALTIACICYVNFFIENELKRMMWLYVMFVPAVVYFGALLFTTTFPRRVREPGMRLSLSASDDSVIFCWAQVAIFVPMTLAFIVVAQMHWRPSPVNIFAAGIFGVFPVAACIFAAYRLQLVLKASRKSTPFREF
jgi:hypothetical protein